MRSGNRLKAALVGVGIVSSIMASRVGAGPLPTSGLVLGLGADSGVTTTSGTVTGWADESTSAQAVNNTVGTPTLSTIVTPNGTHPAINFNGSAGLGLTSTLSASMALQSLSIFVVANLNVSNTSAEFISDYVNDGTSRGWADGISDGSTNQPKWFTGPDGADALGATTGATLAPGATSANAYLMTETISSAGLKNANTANGLNAAINQPSTPDTVSGINYDATPVNGGIGYLNFFGGIQFLDGHIAEILVYNNAAPGYSASAVNSYLVDKYFATPEPSSLALLGLGGLAGLRRRRQA